MSFIECSSARNLSALAVVGSRSEAIKLAPVIRELQRRSTLNSERPGAKGSTVKVCATGQHRQMLDQVLNLFGIVPDYGLDVMEDNQSPIGVASAVLAWLEPIL